MTRVYLDTSAAGKLLVEEAESAALAQWVDEDHIDLVATFLLETELRRLAVRQILPQVDVTVMLEGVSLYELTSSVFREAGLLPGKNLRSLDALHLAGAIRLGAEAIATYDGRLAEAAGEVGIRVVAPS